MYIIFTLVFYFYIHRLYVHITITKITIAQIKKSLKSNFNSVKIIYCDKNQRLSIFIFLDHDKV